MKKPSKESLKKLSQLQKLVLVMLLEERYAQLKRPAFRDLCKKLYWGERHALLKKELVAKSLSRALGRLEARRYIERTPSGWRLTDSLEDLANSGDMFALLAWRQNTYRYAVQGLRGPLPLKSPDLSAQAPEHTKDRPGVKVDLEI